MHRLLLVLLSIAGLGGALTALANTPEGETPSAAPPEVAEARAIVGDFFKELKGTLMSAINEGGAENGVHVCADVAPQIAAEASAGNDWSVGRTALRVRNPDNRPDTWERSVMETFLARSEGGQPVKGMEHYEVVETDGSKTFRYMKAIPTGAPCLACHGETIPPQVADTIDQYYPEDEARGFELGELRGAFTLSKPVE